MAKCWRGGVASISKQSGPALSLFWLAPALSFELNASSLSRTQPRHRPSGLKVRPGKRAPRVVDESKGETGRGNGPHLLTIFGSRASIELELHKLGRNDAETPCADWTLIAGLAARWPADRRAAAAIEVAPNDDSLCTNTRVRAVVGVSAGQARAHLLHEMSCEQRCRRRTRAR